MNRSRRATQRWALLLGLAGLLTAGQAQAQPATTTFSRSGQFVIHAAQPGTPTLNRLARADESGRISLHADLLAVGCERIKAGLLAELGLLDQWQGKVHVRVLAGLAPDQAPRLGATRFRDGWQYSLTSAAELKPDQLVRAVVGVLLMELVNRGPGVRAAEPPLWLVEGLTAAVLARIGPDLVPAHNPLRARVADAWGQLDSADRVAVMTGEREQTRAVLRQESALTFEELGLPVAGALEGAAGRRYRASAEVFLLELRRLPGGEDLLRGFLAALPRHWNWQMAFLEVYQAHFTSLLEVEKWWAMASFQFTVGQTALSWPVARSLTALEEALAVTVEVRSSARELPRRERLSLQQAIRDLPSRDLPPVFGLKVRQLTVLQVSLDPQVAALARRYQALLESRYARFDEPWVRRALAARLDSLDQERRRMAQIGG